MGKEIKLKILNYHYLKRDDEFKRVVGIDYELFKKQLDYLIKEYPIVDFKEIDGYLKKENDLPKQCSVLTFDDGLKEHADIIMPYLDNLGIKAIFFLPSCLAKKRPAIPQAIHFSVAHYGIRKFYQLVEKHFKSTALAWDDYKINNIEDLDIYSLLKEVKNLFKNVLPRDEAYKILNSIWFHELGSEVDNLYNKVYMSKQDIDKIIKQGHSIGLHSATHPAINDSNFSKELFSEEIAGAKAELENAIGQKVKYFAYPYGLEDDILYDEANINKFREIGLKYLFITFKKANLFNPNFIYRYHQVNQGIEKKFHQIIK